MASATGVPDGPIHERIDTIDSNAPEDEPLLGSAGDAAQKPEQPLYHNLIIGMLVPKNKSQWRISLDYPKNTFADTSLFVISQALHPSLKLASSS